mgnify:CR=1 FL=1|tara:strand:- start:313 stop:1311 length:999 start_codon:yes stop_codon:yes gene_type:complete
MNLANKLEDQFRLEYLKCVADDSSLGYPALNVALGKTLIASAWVDGVLNDDEMNCLKALVLQMPNINFEDWRKLKIYLAYPISESEQKAIVDDFIDKVYNKGHQTLAWNALLQVLQADGVITIEEKVFAHELQHSLSESSSKFLRKLKYFFFHAQIQKEPVWKGKLKGRDKFIHEFFDNPVYFIFRKALLKEDFIVTQSKPELQKICLFAAILCWIASEDSRIDLTEKDFIIETLTDICGLNQDIANCILEVANSIDISELQLSQLVRSLSDATEEEERHKLFMILAEMVSIDKILTTHECECLRTVALYLEIRKSVWYKAMEDIHLKTTFS